MDVSALLSDGLSRASGQVPGIVEGLTVEDLGWRPDDEANPIGWLVWHLTRVEDDHLAAVAGTEQRWTAGGWADRYDLPFDVGDIGYGHTVDQVGRVRAPAELLVGYHEAVARAAQTFVSGLAPADLDRVVDEHRDPPVTLGVRLVSVVAEVNQHVGQAAYVRGLLERR